MNKRIINGEATVFLVALAILGMAFGVYTLMGRGILESDGVDFNTVGGWFLLALSITGIGAALGALATILSGRVGGWWILGSWLSGFAWFGLAHVVI